MSYAFGSDSSAIMLFGVNSTLTKFIGDINNIVYQWIESVKQIKIFANPAVDKYENKLN